MWSSVQDSWVFTQAALVRHPVWEGILLFASLHYIVSDLRIPLGDSRFAKLFSHL